VDALQRISGGKCLLISADKGYNRDDALVAGLGAPGIVPHADGCFSMMVDYQMIGDYVERLGGIALHPTHPHESLNVSAFVIGENAGAPLAATRRGYEEAVERFGPDDIFALTPVLESGAMSMTIEQTIACIRLSCMDFRLLWTFLPLWKARAGESTAVQRRELLRIIRAVWDHYYPIGEEEDLSFHLGVLLLEFGFYSDSLEFLRHSEAQYGVESGTAYNMGVCYFHLREKQKALDEMDRALALYPDFDAAKALRILISSSL
jgi:tetratricopeptide (TPR) repeat protein